MRNQHRIKCNVGETWRHALTLSLSPNPTTNPLPNLNPIPIPYFHQGMNDMGLVTSIWLGRVVRFHLQCEVRISFEIGSESAFVSHFIFIFFTPFLAAVVCMCSISLLFQRLLIRQFGFLYYTVLEALRNSRLKSDAWINCPHFRWSVLQMVNFAVLSVTFYRVFSKSRPTGLPKCRKAGQAWPKSDSA